MRSLNIYVTCSRNFLLTAGKSTSRPIMMEKPHYGSIHYSWFSNVCHSYRFCCVHEDYSILAMLTFVVCVFCVFFRRLAFVRNPGILEYIRFIAIISLYLIDLRLSRHWWNWSSSKRNWNNARLITFAVPIHIVCMQPNIFRDALIIHNASADHFYQPWRSKRDNNRLANCVLMKSSLWLFRRVHCPNVIIESLIGIPCGEIICQYCEHFSFHLSFFYKLLLSYRDTCCIFSAIDKSRYLDVTLVARFAIALSVKT